MNTIKQPAKPAAERAPSYYSASLNFESDYPTHSCVLGADGMPLEYEPRPTIGFDLTPRATRQDKGE